MNATSAAKIIPFPTKTSDETPVSQTTRQTTSPNDFLSDEVMRKIFAAPEFNDYIKSLVEGNVARLIANAMMLKNSATDNPFDSIYLYDLKPDTIDRSHIEKLKKYSGIKDLSEGISFVNEWDD